VGTEPVIAQHKIQGSPEYGDIEEDNFALLKKVRDKLSSYNQQFIKKNKHQV